MILKFETDNSNRVIDYDFSHGYKSLIVLDSQYAYLQLSHLVKKAQKTSADSDMSMKSRNLDRSEPFSLIHKERLPSSVRKIWTLI